MQVQQQAVAVILRLGGQARELARELTPEQVLHGGDVDGVHRDPLGFLMHHLSARFSPLGEEVALRSISDLTGFTRMPNERVDELISRFDTTHHRANAQGNFQMSISGLAMKLLQACGVNHEQLLQVLSPIQGRLPQNEDELRQMQSYLRRMGHILEAFPNNVAHSLGQRQPHQPTFFGSSGGQPVTQDQSTWGWGAGLGSNQGLLGGPWDPPQGLYPASAVDSGTESDTSSDDWDTPAPENPFLQQPAAQQEESVYWQYAQAKRLWRRYTQKPTRKVRRFVKRRGGKGGKGARQFMAEWIGYGGGKGQGKNARRSGKGGFGRRLNPKGRDGNVLRCSICESDTHLRARCPRRPADNSQASTTGFVDGLRPGLFTEQPADAPTLYAQQVDAASISSYATGASAEVPPSPTPSYGLLLGPEVPAPYPDPWLSQPDPWAAAFGASANLRIPTPPPPPTRAPPPPPPPAPTYTAAGSRWVVQRWW